MEMPKASRKQYSAVKAPNANFNAVIASHQAEAAMFDKLSNVMMAVSDTSVDRAVTSLKKDGHAKAYADASEGKLDLNATTWTVHGQAYAEKAKQIFESQYLLDLAEVNRVAETSFPEDVEGYQQAMDAFHDKRSVGLSDEQKLYMQQHSQSTTEATSHRILENRTNLINQDYVASLTGAMQHSRKEILQFADLGKERQYHEALDGYDAIVDATLDMKLISAPKAQELKKTQRDEGTSELILSEFDRLLDTDVDVAIGFAKKFSTAIDETIYGDTRDYDTYQRDVMYGQMVQRINGHNKATSTIKAKAIKYNNTQVRNALDVMRSGGVPSNSSEVMSFTGEEIDKSLFDELRFESLILPERMLFNEMSPVEQFQHIERLEAGVRAGEGQDTHNMQKLDSFKKQYKATSTEIEVDPASVRKRGLHGSLAQWDGNMNTVGEFLTDNQGSVDTFARQNGGKKNYFTEAEATVLGGRFAQMEDDDKLGFILQVDGALGDDSRYVFDQLGEHGYQMSVLAHTTKLDPSGGTSRSILGGSRMLALDKSLLPKTANVDYNSLDKSTSSLYTPDMKQSIKDSTLALAVANNGGGVAENINSSMLKTAYQQVVGQTMKDFRLFRTSKEVVAPWRGAKYGDFQIKLETLTIDDMPDVGDDKTKQTLLDVMQADESNVLFKSVGVGAYEVYINGKPVNQFTDDEPVEGLPRRMEKYILRLSR